MKNITFWLKTPKILRFLTIYIFSFTLFCVILRLIFWFVYDSSDAPLTSEDFIKASWLGFKFDLRIVIATILPLFYTSIIPWFNPFFASIIRKGWLLLLSVSFAIISIFYVFDFGHYSYLGSRINFTVIRFLKNPSISAQMLWESYPVIWILAAYLGSIAIFYYLVGKLFKKIESQEILPRKWWQSVMFGSVSFLLIAMGAYGKFSYYPLRWSEAAFSDHPFATQLTYNPVHYFFDTWKNGGMTFDLDKTKKYYPLMADYLNVKDKDISTLNYKRKIIPINENKKMNIVAVIVESLASYKTSLSKNPLNPTPNLQTLADEGYYFKNFFTPSTGTARSIWTIITGTPDVELNGTSSRNPLVVDQYSLGNHFKGYEKFYFLGGSASWGNVRGVLTKNIDNLKLYEEGSYSSPRMDVWGISDIDLFREANNVFKEQQKPFFAIIQTSGNHRPYTIPKKSYGFKVQDIEEKNVRKFGFHSTKEYNAYLFSDHAIGHFIELAKESGYANNSIFAFWGDHGINGEPTHTRKSEMASKLNLGSLRVPLVIWAPGLIKEAKVINTVASEVDVLPTLASLAGQGVVASAMGRDLFDMELSNQRYAFTIEHGRTPLIGMIGDEFYYRTRSDGSGEGLYGIDSETPLDNLVQEYPNIANNMKDLTYGFYYTSQYIIHNNKRELVNTK